MPPPYTRHVFVCTNRRPEGSPRGCCATKGGDEVRLALKKAVDAAGISDVRINASGCLDACERGVAVVVYPEGTWYGGVTGQDVVELAASLRPGAPAVERLRMAPIQKRNG
jgi:(2Fe-2S) ferredoxin